MTIHAYVLAADPTWLDYSVKAYYPHVDKIVVSYDEESRGWTGAPVPVESCLAALRALDRDGKLEFRPGRFAPARNGAIRSPLEAETRQRQVALKQAATGADWVIQIDTDEVLPRWEALRDVIDEADRRGLAAVEWPMRVLYRGLRNGRFLQVVTPEGAIHFEYPGPVAVRSDATLTDCRRGDAPFLRPVVFNDRFSLQITRQAEGRECRAECVESVDAIWHNSWARPAPIVRTKIKSWGHNRGTASWLYYYTRWLPAPVTWRLLRNFNPVYPPLWPRLGLAPAPPLDPEPRHDEPTRRH